MTSTTFELASLFNLLLASVLLTFAAYQKMSAREAYGMFVLMNFVTSLMLVFQVDVPHVLQFAVAGCGIPATHFIVTNLFAGPPPVPHKQL